MDSQLLLIGQIFEASDSSYTDKKTGETISSATVQVEQVSRDENGKRFKSVEKLRFPIELLGLFEKSLDKFIVIPYQVRKFGDKMSIAPILNGDFLVASYTIFDFDPTPKQKPVATPKL